MTFAGDNRQRIHSALGYITPEQFSVLLYQGATSLQRSWHGGASPSA